MHDEGSIHLDDAYLASDRAKQTVDHLDADQRSTLLYFLTGYTPDAVLRGCEINGWEICEYELGSVSDGYSEA